jgi:hypothetical protein
MQVQLISWNRKKQRSMAHMIGTGDAKTLCDNIPGTGTALASLNEYPLCSCCVMKAHKLGIPTEFMRNLPAPPTPKLLKSPSKKKPFLPNPYKNILCAIQYLGGINPRKLRRAGWWTEFHEFLPASIRRRIFRHASTNSVDSIATELGGYGYPVQDVDSLLEYLKDRKKVNWSQEPQEVHITNEDYLELRINELLKENETLRQQIENLTRAEGCFDPVEMEEPF